jgi:hypothetical protein
MNGSLAASTHGATVELRIFRLQTANWLRATGILTSNSKIGFWAIF